MDYRWIILGGTRDFHMFINKEKMIANTNNFIEIWKKCRVFKSFCLILRL